MYRDPTQPPGTAPPPGTVPGPQSLEEAEELLRQMAKAILPDVSQHAPLHEDSGLTQSALIRQTSKSAKVQPAWSEDTFRKLVELAPDSLVIIDQQGNIVLVNSQTESLFGYSRDELLGRVIEILVPERFRERHVGYRDRYINQPRMRPMGAGLELSGRRKDGRDFPVEISLSPLETETGPLVAATVRDITVRKRLEARYRTLLEGIPAVTFMAALDQADNEFYVSPQIEQMLGFSQKEWLGDPFLWYRQLHPEDRKRWGEEFARTCSAGVNFSSEYRFLSRDNRVVWVRGEARVVRDDHGRPLFLQGIAFDISESKRAEQSLRRSAEELERKVKERTSDLEEATIRAESASQARASFLANMSHEIRTPLNAIIGFADLLRRRADTDDAERMEWLEIIHSGGQHLLALINDILDLSKVDAGKLNVESVPYSPIKTIEEVSNLLRPKADEKGLKLETAFEGPLPRMIVGDPTRLRQMLMNIAGNAIKFTKVGGVRISTWLDQSQPDQPALVLQIADTGIGIAADKLTMIFDPFTQADSSITRQFGGTGLGLAISRRLAEAMGGNISVESEVGRGTTFTCVVPTGSLTGVPLVEGPERAAPVVEARPEALSLPARNYHVLVVDDGETNRKLIRLILERAGVRVTQAENGLEALERSAETHFDTILLDMQMPVMDGYTAARKLRSRGVTVPIIALTANAMQGDDKKCLEAGCSGYFPKPIDQTRLMVAVAAALEAGAQTATGATHRPAPAASESLALLLEEVRRESTPAGDLLEAAYSSAAGGDGNGHPHGTEPSDLPKIVSSLPMDDDDFREIVIEFVECLDEKLCAMQTAWESGDFPQLAALGHWLKGTGPSTGFADFAQPCDILEQLALRQQREAAGDALASIRSLASRISID